MPLYLKSCQQWPMPFLSEYCLHSGSIETVFARDGLPGAELVEVEVYIAVVDEPEGSTNLVTLWTVSNWLC